MKRSLLCFAMFLMTISSLSQVHIGVTGGVGVENVSFQGKFSDNFDDDNHPSFFIGPTLKIDGGGAGLDASVLYRQQKTVLSSREITQKTISIPANIRYGVPLIPAYVFAGPQLDFNIGENQFNVLSIRDRDFILNDTNLSINLGAGVMLGGIQLAVSYNIPCGNTGEFNKQKALSTAIDTINGDLKTNRWQASLSIFF